MPDEPAFRSRLDQEAAESIAHVLRLPEWSYLLGELPLSCLDELQRQWAEVHGTTECVAVSSGTTALTLTLRALDLPPGDEVLVPAYGCPAVDVAVHQAGLTPVHVEIDPRTYGMSPAHAAAAMTPRTAAIVAVHFGGQPAHLRSVAAVAERQGLALIEDACLAPGAAYAGRPVGSWGIAGVFSLGVRKPISAGEGGLITTNDARLAARLRRLRSLGLDLETDDIWEPSGNFRLTELQAAVVLPQLERLEEERARRTAAAAQWTAALAANPALRPLELDQHASHAWAQCWLRWDEQAGGRTRLELVSIAQALGIPLFEGWPRPNYTLGMYSRERAAPWLNARNSGREPDHYERTRCPHAEHAAYNEAVLLDFPSLNAGLDTVEAIAERLAGLSAELPAKP